MGTKPVPMAPNYCIDVSGLSYKPQASSPKPRKVQATSFKPRATRFKLQAASNKLPDHVPRKKFHGARTEGLNADERIVRMAHMP